MIDRSLESEAVDREAWRHFLTEGLLPGGFPPDDLSEFEYANAVADAVAVYCIRELPSSRVPLKHLMLLMASALRQLNNDTAAICCLQDGGCSEEEIKAVMPLLLDASLSPTFWMAWTSGMIKLEGVLTGCPDRVCVLSLDRLRYGDDDIPEMSLPFALRHLIKRLASVWHKDDGRGILGLRGMRRWKEYGAWSYRGQTGSRALVDCCKDILAFEGRARDWSHTPQVVVMEINQA